MAATLAAHSASAAEIAERIVREDECLRRTGLSRTTRWRMEKEGTFPRRRRLGKNSSGWLDSEIIEWIRQRELA
jgi:prophage regulatory protein